jgi:hypothetical protein
MASFLPRNLSRTDRRGALWRETAWSPLPGSGSPLGPYPVPTGRLPAVVAARIGLGILKGSCFT